MGKKQAAKKAAAKGRSAKDEAQSAVGKAVDVVSETTGRGKAALGGLVSRGQRESQSALSHAKAAVDELVRLGVVQANRAEEAVQAVYERGTSKIGLGGDDAPAPATQEDVAALRREIAALRAEIKALEPAPVRRASTARKPAAPRAAAAKPATAPRATAARATPAKPAAKRTPAKPAAAKPAPGTTRRRTPAVPAPSPDAVPPAPGSTGASGATSS